MFRKSLTGLAMFGGLLAGGIAPVESARADEHHHRGGHQDHRAYYVYHRDCPDSRWVCYGGYCRAEEAHHAANRFRHNGYEAFFR
jgi:hypothetical protein